MHRKCPNVQADAATRTSKKPKHPYPLDFSSRDRFPDCSCSTFVSASSLVQDENAALVGASMKAH
jgi:hypothetical protein